MDDKGKEKWRIRIYLNKYPVEVQSDGGCVSETGSFQRLHLVSKSSCPLHIKHNAQKKKTTIQTARSSEHRDCLASVYLFIPRDN